MRTHRFGNFDSPVPKIITETTKLVASRIMGAVLLDVPWGVEGPLDTHPATIRERWRLTDRVDDLSRPDREFIQGNNLAAVWTGLEDRYPAPGKAGRVTRDENYNTKETDLLVYRLPRAELVKYGDNRFDQVEALQEYCAAHGPLLAETDFIRRIREEGAFDDKSDLVVGDAGVGGFQLIKHNPSRAQARRTRAERVEAKEIQEHQREQARRAWVVAVSKAYLVLRDQLPNAILAVIAQGPGAYHYSYQADEYVVRQGGWGTTRVDGCRYAHVELGPALIALIRLHQKYKGQSAYRADLVFQGVLSAYRAMDESTRWVAVKPAAAHAFFEAEAARKPPRPKPEAKSTDAAEPTETREDDREAT